MFDEYSDVASVKDAQEMVDIVMDALRNPHKPRPKDENILGEIAKQCVQTSLVVDIVN